jgi:hypothetical protein
MEKRMNGKRIAVALVCAACIGALVFGGGLSLLAGALTDGGNIVYAAGAVGGNAGAADRNAGAVKNAGHGAAGGGIGVTAAKAKTTKTVVRSGAASWVSQAAPGQRAAAHKDKTTVKVGLNKKGKADMGLVRFSIPSDIKADKVVSARLWVRKKSGSVSGIRIGTLTKAWGKSLASWKGLKGAARFGLFAPQLEKGKNDWYSADVTSAVKEKLRGKSGKSGNYGFALRGKNRGESARLYSFDARDGGDRPRLVIRHR